MQNKKHYKEFAQIFKGVANHHRVHILNILEKQAELSLGEIADNLNIDYRTASEHIRKLALAGLIMKRHEGSTVRHALTNRAKSILKFCRILE